MPTILTRCLVGVLLVSAGFAQQPRDSKPRDELAALRAELAAARTELANLRELDLAPPSPVHGSIGVDLTTHYLFRGLPQENQGVIAQPHCELGVTLAGGSGPFGDVGLAFGIWNSLHDGPTGSAGSCWYESDNYAKLSTTVADRFAIASTYTAYHSPNSSFGTVQELALTIAFDDHELLLDGGLRPSCTFAFEVNGQADAGSHLGTFAQVGIAPAFALGGVQDITFELSTPVQVGMSMRDYYELPGGGGDEALGFVDVGVVIAANLPASQRLGASQLTCGLHYLVLGDSNQARNGGDDDELVGSIGITMSF